MNPLPELLEGTEDGREVLVKFINGNCFGLSDFEMVDESIYQRTDLCVCDIVSIVKVEREVYKIGSKLEFSLEDVFEIADIETGESIYKNPS